MVHGRPDGSRLDREEDRALAAGAQRAQVVAAGQASTVSPASSAKPRSSSAETSRSRSRRSQRRAGSPWPPSSKIVVRVTLAARGVVLRRVGLGHDRAGLRVEARPLEHDPAVEAGEVLGVGQPDVDDGEPARTRGGRPAPERRRAGRSRVGRTSSELRAMNARPKRPASGRRSPTMSASTRVEPVLGGRRRWRRLRARSSIAGSRSTPVTAWPASASGTASRPVPTHSSRIGPSARSASAR